MPPSPPPSAPEIHIEIEMQPPPPILLSPPSPPHPPINVQPRPQLSSYNWEWRRYVALVEMCFFLTLFIGFGAIVYLSVCALVTLIEDSDQTYCYDFL